MTRVNESDLADERNSKVSNPLGGPYYGPELSHISEKKEMSPEKGKDVQQKK